MTQIIEMTKTPNPTFTHHVNILERHVEPLLRMTHAERLEAVLSIDRSKSITCTTVPRVKLLLGWRIRGLDRSEHLDQRSVCAASDLIGSLKIPDAAQGALEVPIGSIHAQAQVVPAPAKIELDQIVVSIL
jgi:hypothetical protein